MIYPSLQVLRLVDPQPASLHFECGSTFVRSVIKLQVTVCLNILEGCSWDPENERRFVTLLPRGFEL